MPENAGKCAKNLQTGQAGGMENAGWQLLDIASAQWNRGNIDDGGFFAVG